MVVQEHTRDSSEGQVPDEHHDPVEMGRELGPGVGGNGGRDATPVVDDLQPQAVGLGVHPPDTERLRLGRVGGDVHRSVVGAGDARGTPGRRDDSSIRGADGDDHRPPAG